MIKHSNRTVKFIALAMSLIFGSAFGRQVTDGNIDLLTLTHLDSSDFGKIPVIVEAESGDKAEAQFKKECPDLVLLDIIMPDGEGEGLRVLQEIMKADPGAQVVMITAVGQDIVKKECKKLGVLDYLVKPFDEEQVIEIADRYLS